MLIMNIYTLWGLRRIFKDVTNGMTKLIYPPFQGGGYKNGTISHRTGLHAIFFAFLFLLLPNFLWFWHFISFLYCNFLCVSFIVMWCNIWHLNNFFHHFFFRFTHLILNHFFINICYKQLALYEMLNKIKCLKKCQALLS